MHSHRSTGRAHEERPEGTSRVDTEVPKAVLRADVALRVRDLVRQIAMEHELEIYLWQGRTRPRSRVPELPTDTEGEPDHAVAQGDELADVAAGVQASEAAVLGPSPVGAWLLGSELGDDHGRDDQAVHRRSGRRTDSRRQSISNRRGLTRRLIGGGCLVRAKYRVFA